MKIGLLFPNNSNSLKNTFENALINLGHLVVSINTSKSDLSYTPIKKVDHLFKRCLPKYGILREAQYRKKINELILRKIVSEKPEIVISYNDNYLNIDTLNVIKLYSRFVLFLADNPFYSFNKKGFLELAISADYCITPDSAAVAQLKMIGIKNIMYSNIGYDSNVFYKLDLKESFKKQYSSDVFFLGNIHYIDSWAYKRPLMLSYLSEFNLKIMGNKSWKRVLSKFPELEKNFTYLKDPISNDELNRYMNYSKIYPIDHHPGILNGIHTRVFDAIAGNILPVVEYRKDLIDTFTGVYIPVFYNYEELKDKTRYYLKNSKEREDLLCELQEFIREKYLSKHLLKNILRNILTNINN